MRLGSLGRAAALGTLGVALCACGEPTAGRDILLVILDTTRADHLSCYGYPRPTTPNLDRLAAEGERYRNAWAQAPWTLPAVATILTGQPPHVHGAGRGRESLHPVREGVPNLAEHLSRLGYRTAAFVNVVFCSPESGLARGFEVYDFHTSDATNTGQRTAEETTDAALAWLRGLRAEDRFFLVVHYFDPHLTYDPPPPYDTMFEKGDGPSVKPGFGSAAQVFALRAGTLRLSPELRRSLVARYDGEIRYVDGQFARLRRELEALGRWDGTLVIVVADHGEEFWEHGSFEHGHSHHREVLHVPLIVRRPGGPRGVVREARVRQLDIAPTVLRFAGAAVPEDLPGAVLGQDSSARYAVAEGSLWAGDLVSVRCDAGTLIVDRTSGRRWFYGPEDPWERRDLLAAGARPEALGRLERLVAALPPTPREQRGAWTPTEEQLDRLRSLGYIP